MNALNIVIVTFSAISAFDYLIGNKLGLGDEFKKSFQLLGSMALSMIGMIVIAPLLATLLFPFFDGFYNLLHIDPSIIPASLFANDMGGAPLATEISKNTEIGNFNALVVSSMMGATLSFTLPVSMQLVNKEHHRELALGILCGVATIPVGCFVSGLICKISLSSLLYDLLPLIILAVILSIGLMFFQNACVNFFKALGYFIKGLVLLGLVIGIINFLAKEEIIKNVATIEEGAMVCVNATIVMTGMFPVLNIVSRIFKKPLVSIGKKIDMDELGILGIVSQLATNLTALGTMNQMNKKSIMLNSAFTVSASFTFVGHLAFTMAFNDEYIVPVIVGKLISGISAFFIANIFYKVMNKNETV